MSDRHTSHSVVDWTHYLTHAEVEALKDLARSLPQGGRIVNIGAGNGTSGLAFMEARADLHLFTIDIQLESSPFGCLQGEQAVFESAGFWGDPRHTQIHGDSKAVGAAWEHGPVDMVFVDGGHQYHEAKGDIEAWLPRIKAGGLLVIHDFEKDNKVWHGVNKAVYELIVGKFEEVLRCDTTIAVRVPHAASGGAGKTTQPATQPATQKARPSRKPSTTKRGRA